MLLFYILNVFNSLVFHFHYCIRRRKKRRYKINLIDLIITQSIVPSKNNYRINI